MFCMIFLITLTSAESNLGTFKQNDCIDLKQTCDNCTYINISSITYPNSTQIILNKQMTKEGIDYIYSLCNTSTLGIYKYTTFGDKDGTTKTEVITFTITYSGNDLDTQKAILYLGLIAILTFLFILVISSIPKLPSSDVVDEEGIILGINNLKYLRPILWGIAWILLLGIMFVTSNISIAYLPTAMFGDFFFLIYRIMFLLTLPMVIIWFVYIIIKLFRDKEMKKMIERGVEMRSTL